MMEIDFGALLLSLCLTLLLYGAYPLLSANKRDTEITKKKYFWKCYGINFLIWLGCFIFEELTYGRGSSGGAYILWTWVFESIGKNKLRERGLLIEDKPTDAKKEKSKSVAQSAANVNSFSHQYTQTRSAENLSAEERELIIRTTLENVNAPEFVIGVANTIDTLFDIRYDDAGIKMMRDLENYILRLENIEEFVQYVPAYSCVCGLMFSLGYLTKEESDQMSRSFTLRVQDKAIEFASMKPEALS